MKIVRRGLCLAVLALNLLLLLPADGGPGPAHTVLAAATRTPGAPAPGAANPPARLMGQSIVFIGASLAAGWFASEGSDFPAVIVRGLTTDTGRPPTVLRLAQPGARVADALAWPVPARASLIVVHLVGNDAGSGRPTPLAAFEADYRALLQRLREGSPSARIVCLGAWLDPNELNRLGVRVSLYDAAVTGTCAAVGGHFVALGTVFRNPAFHGPAGRHVPAGSSDAFHANDAGHAEIARLVLEQAQALAAPPRMTLGNRE